MIFLIVASLLLSLIIGVFLTLIVLPCPEKKPANLLFRLFVGGGLGIGLSSCIHYISLLAGLARYTAAIDVALCLFVFLIFFIVNRSRNRRKRKALPSEFQTSIGGSGPSGKGGGDPKGDATGERPAQTGSSLLLPTVVVFSVALLSSLISFSVAFLKEPHGRWDAWLIWNMHARFLFRGGEGWREAFASGQDWSHWDYPLLLPLSIARGWTYTGGEGMHLPAVMGFLFTFLLLGLLFISLSLLRGRIQGYLGALILMGTPFFIFMGTSQFADIPLALYILMTLVMLFFQAGSPEHRPGAVILAGLAAGFCAWTKNEGLLFLMIVTGTLFCSTVCFEGWAASLRRTAWFLAGALPVLIVVVHFKTVLAPANDLLAGFSVSALSERLFDPSRYERIARAFFITGISFTQGLFDARRGMHLNPGPVNILLLAVYLLLMGIRIDKREKAGLLQVTSVLLLMATGYFFVYVVTPLDLHYHLMTSLNRLFLQLWPGVIFIVFMAASPVEQGTSEGKEPESLPARPTQGRGQGKKMKKNLEAK